MSTVFFQIRIPRTFNVPEASIVEYDGASKKDPGKRVFVSQRPARLTPLVEVMNTAYGLFPVNAQFDVTRQMVRYNLDAATGYSGSVGNDFWRFVSRYAWAVEIYHNPDDTVAIVLANPVSLYDEQDSPVMVNNPEDKTQKIWQGSKFASLNYQEDGTYVLQ